MMNALYANARGAPPIHKQHIIHNIALCSFLFYVHDILLYGKVTYHPPPADVYVNNLSRKSMSVTSQKTKNINVDNDTILN